MCAEKTNDEQEGTTDSCCAGMEEMMRKILSGEGKMVDCCSMMDQMKDQFCGPDGMPDFDRMKRFMQSPGTRP